MRDLSLGEDQISSIAESVSVQRGYEESAFALDTEFERADFALFLGPVLNGSGPLGLLPAERLVPLYATGVCGALPRLAVSAFRCHRTSMEAEVGRIFGAGFVDRDLLTFFAIEAVAAGGLVLLFVYPLLWAAFISALAYWARSQRTPVLRWCAAVLVLLSFKLESDWPSMDALAVAIKLGIMFAVLAGALGAVNALRTKPWTVGRARAAAAAALR
jgi:hypothetical protein